MFEELTNGVLHGAWLAAQWPAHRRFMAALGDPARAQADVLQNLLRANQDSAYGRAYGFKRLRDVREFQTAVPVMSYDELEPWIGRIKQREQGVLTSEPVLMMEKSSGSTSAAKYVPYTRSLRREFQNALAAWLWDMYSHDPRLLCGQSYWVITPLARERETTTGGLNIGFENDGEYFGAVEQYVIRQLMAVSHQIAHVRDTDASLYITLRFLLQARSLAFISAWNPSFLLILLNRLEEFGDQLVHDLEQGSIQLPCDLPQTVAGQLRRAARRDSVQAATLKAMLRTGRLEPMGLWPKLRLISCWTSAAAQPLMPQIQQRFPGVEVQGKGLLATEGIVTIPLHGYGCVPACTSHFLEFMDESGQCPRLLHELEVGREYSVVLTTGGGFWRYRLGDRVRVLHCHDGLPVLEFIGKEDGVSDLCGEKLNSAFASKVLQQLRDQGRLNGAFAMMAPAASTPQYVLFTNGEADIATLDVLLCENPHYSYCRSLGQLAPPALFRIHKDAERDYILECERRGRRMGTVKLTALDSQPGWERVFRGEFISRDVEVVA